MPRLEQHRGPDSPKKQKTKTKNNNKKIERVATNSTDGERKETTKSSETISPRAGARGSARRADI
jgi:hypothetical protein